MECYSKLLTYIDKHNSFCSLDFNFLGFETYSEALDFLNSLQSFGNIFFVKIKSCSWCLTYKGKVFIEKYNSINNASENKNRSHREDFFYDILNKIENEKVESIEERFLKKYEKEGYIRKSDTCVLEVTKGDGFSNNLKLADELTVDMLTSEFWKGVTFSSYNFDKLANAGKSGSFHDVYSFISEVRYGLFELGFKEVVVSSFFEKKQFKDDILEAFKEEHDWTYRVTLNDDIDQALIQYPNQEKKTTNQNFLRSNLFYSLLSEISALKSEPSKLFTIGKVFQSKDCNHLNIPEFHALEVMLSGADLDLSNILGVCVGLFSRLNITGPDFKQIYFPHTSPTIGIYLYNEVLDIWISVGEGGIVRPELMKKLGFNENDMVLRLGFSLERILMNKKETDDINKLL